MLREVAEAEDGPASVISTGLNLGLPSPDPAHTDTISSCHRPPSHLSDRGGKKKNIKAIQTVVPDQRDVVSSKAAHGAVEMMKIFGAFKGRNKPMFRDRYSVIVRFCRCERGSDIKYFTSRVLVLCSLVLC